MSSAVISQKGTERAKSGHPWIFQSDIVSFPEPVTPGQIVDVRSHKSQFLGQAFFSPHSQITLRMLHRSQEEINRAFFKKRIEAAAERRRHIQRKSLRLVHGESDLLPSFIVDRYEGVFVFQTLSTGMEARKEELISLLEEIFQPKAIVERNDAPVRDREKLARQKGIVRGGFASPLIIQDSSLSIEVDPLEGQKTGLFLDQIENYEAARSYARGKTLDLFCYQGGFGLRVASEVETVTSVDSSAGALQKLEENLIRNRISNVTPVEANAFDYLRSCDERRELFDTIILDPPPFVRSRQNLMGAERGYKEINLRALKILKPGGILITCSCSQNFTPALFEKTLLEAARDTRRDVQILERRGAAIDHPVLLNFPESFYLQCWILRVI